LLLLLVFDSHDGRAKFERLYSKYKDLLYYKAWDILHDQMLAEDAVSEAFIRVFRNLHKIDDVESPRCAAFLVTIARNCALTILARRRQESVGSGEDFEQLVDPQDVEQTVICAVTFEEASALLEQLDELSRNIFILKYAYDLPHGEIAAQLGLTENNVAVKLHRARRKLHQMLSAQGDGGGRREDGAGAGAGDNGGLSEGGAVTGVVEGETGAEKKKEG
jgi:RNA polymerase sigma-70 factor (ECF subfamily)